VKKLLLVSVVLILAAGAVFADDAKVMPKMVGRLWIAPTFGFAPGGYDNGAAYHSYNSTTGKELKMFNLGFALEYGIIDWITGAVQWAPGVTVWSDMDMGATGPEANVNGVADLFVGAKVQIIGEKAPVKTDRFRLALGPGVKIPLPGQDFAKQLTKMTAGETITPANLDHHVFGAGARVYFDYIFNEHFFLNLYNETIFYPVKGPIKNASLTEYGALQEIKSPLKLNDPNLDADVGYNYDLTFELEPVYTATLGKGITLTASLPVNYSFVPGHTYSVSGESVAGNNAAAKAALEAASPDTHSLKVRPTVSFFFTQWVLPTDIGLSYSLPVMGKNSMARHDITLKVKLYFALPGARS
jgi:hypothetical protein